ncbi:hypothetical protein VTJ83DRAFT_6035 [Remersonia thermophila]|uniref:Uncharacterized protein n=1 Tax=Remersonia thermophila TaxID=72144 RepID=A0ABR4D8N6_9PEZI
MASSPQLPALSRTRSHRSIFREDFDSPPPSGPFAANPANNNTTTTITSTLLPRPASASTASAPNLINIHRLASDHNFVFAAHPTPRRVGFLPFLATHLSLPACFGAGVVCVAVAIAYTAQLARHALECPAWATNCSAVALDGWTVSRLAAIQGMVGMVYLLGMAALARAALGVGETTVWGLLKGQTFTVRGLDAFLRVARGEAAAAPRAAAREALREKGDFTARAVRLRTEVGCRPYRAGQLTGNGVRPQPQLTGWVEAFDFASDRRTRATLVFAAVNGTIEGGETAPLSLGTLTSVSAVACDVDIEAVEGILSVRSAQEVDAGANGRGQDDGINETEDADLLPALSSLSALTLPSAAPDETRLNQLLLWFAVAPLLTSPSVNGAQPMFANLSAAGYALPLPRTLDAWDATNLVEDAVDVEAMNTWTIPGLTHFIRVSIGALAQATITAGSPSPFIPTPVTTIPLTITTTLPTLSYPRALLLLLPVLLAIALTLLLVIYTCYLHKHHSIPVLRPFSLGELLKSSQTRWAREVAGADAAKPFLPNEMGAARVALGVDADGVGGFIAAEEVQATAHDAVQGKQREGRRGARSREGGEGVPARVTGWPRRFGVFGKRKSEEV